MKIDVLKSVTACLFALLLLVGGIDAVLAQEQNAVGETQNTEGSNKVDIRGVVKDENGEPLVGATVRVKGTEKGQKTDAEGRFAFGLDIGSTIVISFIGYETKEVSVKDDAPLTISMKTKAKQQDEIVVVGYGIQAKRDVTGSVATVNAEALTKTTTSDPLKALQGKVAGVSITNVSGRADDKPEVVIRGPGTLNNYSPLYVVDGVVLGDEGVKLTFISSEDIESIDVLKDASATAIYGARGANGVILITTKKGKEGRTNVSISAYAGVQVVQKRINMVNSQTYAEMYNEFLGKAYYNPQGVGSHNYWNDIFQVAPVHSYNIQATGGTKSVSYAISGNAYFQQGVLPRDYFSRISVRANNEYKLFNELKSAVSLVALGHDLSYAYLTKSETPQSAIDNAYRFEPVKSLKKDNGDYETSIVNVGNPLLSIEKQENKTDEHQFLGNLYLKIDFLDGFSFKAVYGLQIFNNEYKGFTPSYDYGSLAQNLRADLTVSRGRKIQWIADALLSYNKEFEGIHKVNVVLGYSMSEFNNEWVGGTREGFPGNDPIYWYLDAGTDATTQKNWNNAESWSLMSFFGRGSYSLMDRYLLTLTFRADGSSRFGANNRFGYFPAVGLGWRISKEDFIKNLELDWLDDLKLRVSWGQTGNDRIGNYASYSNIISNDGTKTFFGKEPQTAQPGSTQTKVSNPSIKWEVVTQWDVGLEWSLFGGMLTGEIDYYNKKTDGILVQVPLPSIVGAEEDPTVNAAQVLNQGLEALVSFRETVDNLKYNISANVSYNINSVLSLGTGREYINGGGIAGAGAIQTTRTVVGMPMAMFYGYICEGVFQNQNQLDNLAKRGGEKLGDLRYKDLNGDGKIDEKDKTFIGNPWPKTTLNVSVSLEYAGFDFYMSWTGAFGMDIYNGKKSNRISFYNVEASEANRWSPTNTTSSTLRANSDVQEVSTYFLEDGSYFKLANLVLGYSLPADLTKQIGISKIRFYFSATNVWTFTRYSGFTPEMGTGSALARNIDNLQYPIPAVYTGGVQINF